MVNVIPEDDRLPFFVYGTLRVGEVNHTWMLRGRTAAETPAVLYGALLYDGPGYPYVLTGPAAARVRGEVVHPLPGLYGEVLADLDRLEEYVPGEPDSHYVRVAREVRTAAGDTVAAWVYFAGAATAAALRANGHRIPGGDWKRRR
jgi:gamma-glutamylcyclotransferase (GGCT)/AIG2-like uncharacterized protein YtfP